MDIYTILQHVNGGFSSTKWHSLSPAPQEQKPTSLCHVGKLQESHDMKPSLTLHLIQEGSVKYWPQLFVLKIREWSSQLAGTKPPLHALPLGSSLWQEGLLHESNHMEAEKGKCCFISLFNPRVKTEVSPGQRIRLYGLHSCKLLLSGSTVNAAIH